MPISRVLGQLSNAVLYLAGIGLVVMTGIVAYQVFMRFVINASPAWTEAGSIMLMTWFIFLGAAVGVRENFHMGFDVLLYVLPPSAKPWLRAISDLCVFGFAFGMVFFGGELVIRYWSTRIPVLGLPTAFTYFPIVISGVLMCLFSLERLLMRAAGEPVDDVPTDPTITEA
ncbi:C4-dicarboxylate ABC transporter permease [Devosia psychrophila]|jgi:TRAP-type C4-dicarboxylate transport system permease small subunit|uniref:TRAP transporter small permease protein n=2 Tax=Devosia psychrophila TaxID=728005 RepID=A0A0F5PUR3_9HYPH|nr:C4-dicarboxylate ABC transporter permease [Devosia psychrophila]SFC36643.1 TRAP-type C4-dicarboxylate transport system, small permease component [Devosia psychrophila]